jgi:hypothetical protein
MILNVIDDRKLRYRWEHINAVAEPTWHDNQCPDADQTTPTKNELAYEERAGISVKEAIEWANNLTYSVTLYLSDVV